MPWKPSLFDTEMGSHLYIDKDGDLMLRSCEKYEDAGVLASKKELLTLFRLLADHLGYEIEEDEG